MRTEERLEWAMAGWTEGGDKDYRPKGKPGWPKWVSIRSRSKTKRLLVKRMFALKG